MFVIKPRPSAPDGAFVQFNTKPEFATLGDEFAPRLSAPAQPGVPAP